MIIQSKKVWIAGQFVPAQIEIEQGRIINITAYDKRICTKDYGELRILPGFIDLHTHGAYGFDTNDGEEEGLRDWIKKVTSEGVTSLLPTTVTQKEEILLKAVKNVANVAEGIYDGAEILGIHFEGPFLDMDYKGAQPPEAIEMPDIFQMEKYVKASRGWIRYITLAPEHDLNYELTKWCTDHGIVVSIGHSSEDYFGAIMAFANGAKSMTHVHNGMTSYHHRKPGLVNAALRVDSVYGEIICDGLHVNPVSLNIFFRAKGKEKGIMVTDSLRVKNADPSGSYQLGGHDIVIDKKGLAKLKGTETIAGSTLKMNEGLRILIEEAGVPIDTAINSCTINPATCLGVADRKGKICAGYDADIVILDYEYKVVNTFCRGKSIRDV